MPRESRILGEKLPNSAGALLKEPMHFTDSAKELAARKSLDFIEDGMVVGLGTGSTATCFIKLLGERVQHGLKIRAIPSSNMSKELAESLSIPIINFRHCPEIDVAVDGLGPRRRLA